MEDFVATTLTLRQAQDRPSLSHQGRGTPGSPSPGGRELEGGGHQQQEMSKIRKSTSFSRNLRQKQTVAESDLWKRLKSKQLEGIKFRRQQPIGPYIVDFVSFERKIVVEVDGGQHNDKERMEKDEKRTRWLEGEGFQVLRFWNNDVLTNIEGIIDGIRDALA
jgi:very-short-patch-repair endonuclease